MESWYEYKSNTSTKFTIKKSKEMQETNSYKTILKDMWVIFCYNFHFFFSFSLLSFTCSFEGFRE